MTSYRDHSDDGFWKRKKVGASRQREWARWRRKGRRRTKLKQHRASLTGLIYRRPSWRSFTEIGAGFGDLDIIGDDVSPTSWWSRRKSRRVWAITRKYVYFPIYRNINVSNRNASRHLDVLRLLIELIATRHVFHKIYIEFNENDETNRQDEAEMKKTKSM